MSKSLSLSLIVVALILGMGIGRIFTPFYYANAITGSHENILGEPDRYLDLRYINTMIGHHLSAIDLAEQATKKVSHQELKDLLPKILADEPVAIEELYQIKKKLYNDYAKVITRRFANLGTADEKYDLRFLNALLNHHKEGINMVAEVKKKSSTQEILNNADAVENFLKRTSITLSQLRKNWYKIDPINN